ncbi:MAG TPA: adenylate kinase [Chloroflexota bacterium]|nr:adenylate kinase [Chloroflexota bacterium]
MFVILLGPPGAGKGTQARLIGERLGVPTVSTGELFREEMATGSALGQLVGTFINTGRLVPDDTTLGVLQARLARPDAVRGAVLDGFPRTVRQAEELDRLLSGQGKRVDRVVDVVVPEDELLRRLSGRLTCRNCHATYHETAAPPRVPGRCDRCGGELYQREDDAPEAVRTRLRVYRERTAPLVDYYRRQGKLIAVDGDQPPPVVTHQLLRVIDGAGA